MFCLDTEVEKKHYICLLLMTFYSGNCWLILIHSIEEEGDTIVDVGNFMMMPLWWWCCSGNCWKWPDEVFGIVTERLFCYGNCWWWYYHCYSIHCWVLIAFILIRWLYCCYDCSVDEEVIDVCWCWYCWYCYLFLFCIYCYYWRVWWCYLMIMLLLLFYCYSHWLLLLLMTVIVVWWSDSYDDSYSDVTMIRYLPVLKWWWFYCSCCVPTFDMKMIFVVITIHLSDVDCVGIGGTFCYYIILWWRWCVIVDDGVIVTLHLFILMEIIHLIPLWKVFIIYYITGRGIVVVVDLMIIIYCCCIVVIVMKYWYVTEKWYDTVMTVDDEVLIPDIVLLPLLSFGKYSIWCVIVDIHLRKIRLRCCWCIDWWVCYVYSVLMPLLFYITGNWLHLLLFDMFHCVVILLIWWEKFREVLMYSTVIVLLMMMLIQYYGENVVVNLLLMVIRWWWMMIPESDTMVVTMLLPFTVLFWYRVEVMLLFCWWYIWWLLVLCYCWWWYIVVVVRLFWPYSVFSIVVVLLLLLIYLRSAWSAWVLFVDDDALLIVDAITMMLLQVFDAFPTHSILLEHSTFDCCWRLQWHRYDCWCVCCCSCWWKYYSVWLLFWWCDDDTCLSLLSTMIHSLIMKCSDYYLVIVVILYCWHCYSDTFVCNDGERLIQVFYRCYSDTERGWWWWYYVIVTTFDFGITLLQYIWLLLLLKRNDCDVDIVDMVIPVGESVVVIASILPVDTR